MKIDGTNISMIRGDSESITVSCLNAAGNPIPLVAGDIIYLTVKSSIATEVKIFQKEIITFTDGKAIIEILPSDTKTLQFIPLVYDVQLTKANGVVTTIIPPSKFVIEGEVTYE